MSKVIHIDQGDVTENFYALEDDESAQSCGEQSDLTIDEMGIYDFLLKVDNLLNEVLPQASKIVLDLGNVNEVCNAISEFKLRVRS